MTQTSVRVFVSSTWQDLQPERRAVETVLQRMRETKFIGMEYFGSRDETTHHASLDEVDHSDLYIGILGGRYGSGITEAEYRRARERGLRCYLYFKSETVIPADQREFDEQKSDQLARLKEQLRHDHTITEFSNSDSLAASVTADLHLWLFDEYLRPRLESAAVDHAPHRDIQSLLTSIKDLDAFDPKLITRLRKAGYVIAHGDKSVAIGGDAIGNIIVTGDHSRVLVGDFGRLADSYISAEVVFMRVRLDHFAGREWLSAKVEDFLRTTDRGYFVLEAKAGLGKTTFLAHLAKEKGFIHHFVELTPGADGIGPALKNLSSQIIRAWKLNPYIVDEILPAAAARPNFLENVLFEAARRRDETRPGEKIVLVVDALDEAGTPPGLNALGLPKVIPHGIYFIVSQRPVEVALSFDGPRRVLLLEASDEQNLNDMSVFLTNAATWPGISDALNASGYSGEQFVETLLQKCQGVWIYLHYVLTEIERGARSPLKLDDLPQGVWQYYAQYWQRWRKENIGDWDRLHLPLLSTLAAIQEDLPLPLLCELAGVKEQPSVHRLLEETWRPFLVIQPEEARYRLYHASLREFLSGRTDPAALRENEQVFVREIAKATRTAHSQIADRYLRIWNGLENRLPDLQDETRRDIDGRYGLRHVVFHLEAAGRFAEVHQLLRLERQVDGPDSQKRQFENVWYAVHEQVGDTSGYLSDVALAWQAAARESAEQLAEGQTAPAIGLETRYALLTASVNSLARNIPPELLGTLVQTRVWPPAQGLAFAQRVADEMQRAKALTALAPFLPASLLNEVLATARAIDDRNVRFQALKGIAPCLIESIREDVLKEAVGLAALPYWFGGENKQATALLELAPQLPQPLLTKAVQVVAQFNDSTIQAETLLKLATELPQPPLEELLETARTLKSATHRATLLTALAHRLSDPLKETVVEEAFTTALTIKIESERGRTLGALTPLLAAAGKVSRLKEILAAAREIQGPRARANLLNTLATHLTEPLFGEAITLARTIKNSRRRAEALSTLAMHLPPTKRLMLLQEAVLAAPDVQPDSMRTRVLAALSNCLLESGYVDEALNVVHRIEAGPQKAEALVLVASQVSSSKRSAALEEALKAVRAIQHRWRRAKALTQLAPHLPDPLKEQALQEAVAATEKMRRPSQRTQIVNAVQSIRDPQLNLNKSEEKPPPQRERSLSEMLAAARRIKDRDECASILVRLVCRLPEDFLPETFSAVMAMKNESRKAEALSEVAFLLSPAMVRRALSVAQKIQDLPTRNRLLDHLIDRLKELKLFDEAMACMNLLTGEFYFDALSRHLISLPEPFKQRVFENLPSQVSRKGIDYRSLVQLAPQLPDDCLEECVLSVLPSWDGEILVLGVAGIAAYLKDPLKRRALDKALAQIQTMEPHLEELLALAPHLPEATRNELLDRELEEARSTESNYYRARALGLLATHWSEPEKSKIQREAFAAAKTIKNAEDRAYCLKELLPDLPETLRSKVSKRDQVKISKIGMRSVSRKVSQPDISRLEEIQTQSSEHYAKWFEQLQAASSDTRPELLARLRSHIHDLAEIGGPQAILETFRAVQDAGRWWP